MGPGTVFVDGYNVILATPALAALHQRSLAAARDALLERVITVYRHTSRPVVIVFDGDGTGETSQPIPGFGRGRLVFSRRGETADSVIVRMAAAVCAVGGEALVVTNDFAVRHDAQTRGAQAARADDLRREMTAPPRLLQKRFTHQQAVRRELAEDGDDAEARAEARKKGSARKPPSNRNRGQ
ncbi:MAG: NYN domain-containing protein [Ktedonobacterales bacterium]